MLITPIETMIKATEGDEVIMQFADKWKQNLNKNFG